MQVKIKRLSDTAITPTYGSEYAACMDLYADIQESINNTSLNYDKPNTVVIAPHTTIKIGTGFAFQPPKGYCGLIFARSGLATKSGLRPANCVGVCDEDYSGEYIVAIHNDTDIAKTIHHGDRIAQLMFISVERIDLIEVEELVDTERGEGGFGSTGR